MPTVLIIDNSAPPGVNGSSPWDGLVLELSRHGVECRFHRIPGSRDLFVVEGLAADVAQAHDADLVVLGTRVHEQTRELLAASWSGAGRSVVFLHERHAPPWVSFVRSLARHRGEGEVVPVKPKDLRTLILRRFGIAEAVVAAPGEVLWNFAPVPPMLTPANDALPMRLWREAAIRPQIAASVRISEDLAVSQEAVRRNLAIFRLSTGQTPDGVVDQLGKHGVLEVALRHLSDSNLAKYHEAIESALKERLRQSARLGTPELAALRTEDGNTTRMRWREDEVCLALQAAWRGLEVRSSESVREGIAAVRQWWEREGNGVYLDMLEDARAPGRVGGPPRLLWNTLGDHLPETTPDPLLEDGYDFTNLITWHMAARHRPAAQVVRLAIAQLPGRIWVREEASRALQRFVAVSPPTSQEEAEVWDVLGREIKNHSALLAIAQGATRWPWLPPAGVTACEMYHARGGKNVWLYVREALWAALPDGDTAYARTGTLCEALEGPDIHQRDLTLQKMQRCERGMWSFAPLVANEARFFGAHANRPHRG